MSFSQLLHIIKDNRLIDDYNNPNIKNINSSCIKLNQLYALLLVQLPSTMCKPHNMHIQVAPLSHFKASAVLGVISLKEGRKEPTKIGWWNILCGALRFCSEIIPNIITTQIVLWVYMCLRWWLFNKVHLTLGGDHRADVFKANST